MVFVLKAMPKPQLVGVAVVLRPLVGRNYRGGSATATPTDVGFEIDLNRLAQFHQNYRG